MMYRKVTGIKPLSMYYIENNTKGSVATLRTMTTECYMAINVAFLKLHWQPLPKRIITIATR